jgi:hypothetical protein
MYEFISSPTIANTTAPAAKVKERRETILDKEYILYHYPPISQFLVASIHPGVIGVELILLKKSGAYLWSTTLLEKLYLLI